MINRFLRWCGYEQRALSEAALAGFYSGGDRGSVEVNKTTALTFSAVYRAVSLISSSVSTLPLHLYERNDKGRQRVTDDPLVTLLDSPNEEMDGATFRETLQGHVLTWGNGYAEIERGGGGQPLALYPLAPDRVTPERVNGQLVYKVRQSNGTDRTLSKENVFHLQGFGYDGLIGYSPIEMAKKSISLGLQAELFGERFFANGTHLGGYLERPKDAGPWKEGALQRFADDWAKRHQGAANSHKTPILEDGMKFNQLGIPPEAAQFLQTRQFQVVEIARWFGIPPHLLYDLEHATFSNIEAQGLEFLQGLRYWLSKWEKAIQRSLISDSAYYVEHVTQDLVRADIISRYTAYNLGRNMGMFTVNDIRQKENMPPVEGGDTLLQPLNMQVVGQQPAPDAAKQAQRALLVSTLDRLIRNEANGIRRAAKKPAEFRAAVDDFYQSYDTILRETLEPVFKLGAALGQPADADTFIRKHISDSRTAVLTVEPDQIEATVAGWATRAEKEIP